MEIYWFLSTYKHNWPVFLKIWLFFSIAQYCAISPKSAEIWGICRIFEFCYFQYLKWHNWSEFHGRSPIFRRDIQFFVLFQLTCDPDCWIIIIFLPMKKKKSSRILTPSPNKLYSQHNQPIGILDICFLRSLLGFSPRLIFFSRTIIFSHISLWKSYDLKNRS